MRVGCHLTSRLNWAKIEGLLLSVGVDFGPEKWKWSPESWGRGGGVIFI